MGLSSWGDRLYSGEKSYDFIGRRKSFYAVAAVLMLLSFAAMGVNQFNLGIEFKGGASFQFPAGSATVADAREVARGLNVGEPIVQSVGSDLRVQVPPLGSEAQVAQVTQTLADRFGVPTTRVNASTVSSSWGSDISLAALRGLLFFLVAVVIYISIRFEPRMAAAALVALAHDLVLTAGIYALFGFEVTPATIIALLTILGYSLYDTIVVFDKVQENTRGLAKGSRSTYSEASNLAVNQTVIRSINTSVIALLPVAALLFIGAGILGAGTLKDLALALFVGIAAGTYSSIFIATPVLTDLKEREPQFIALRQRVAAKRSGGAGAVAAKPGRGGAAAGTTTAVLERPDTDSDADGESAPDDDGDPTSSARSGRQVNRGRGASASKTRPGKHGRPSSKRRR